MEKTSYEFLGRINEPEDKILDFLIYLEKETTVKFDISTITGATFHQRIENTETGASMALLAEFYTIRANKLPFTMRIRYCPYPSCQIITFIEIITNHSENEIEIASRFLIGIKKLLPDMDMYLNGQIITDLKNRNKVSFN